MVAEPRAEPERAVAAPRGGRSMTVILRVGGWVAFGFAVAFVALALAALRHRFLGLVEAGLGAALPFVPSAAVGAGLGLVCGAGRRLRMAAAGLVGAGVAAVAAAATLGWDAGSAWQLHALVALAAVAFALFAGSANERQPWGAAFAVGAGGALGAVGGSSVAETCGHAALGAVAGGCLVVAAAGAACLPPFRARDARPPVALRAVLLAGAALGAFAFAAPPAGWSAGLDRRLLLWSAALAVAAAWFLRGKHGRLCCLLGVVVAVAVGWPAAAGPGGAGRRVLATVGPLAAVYARATQELQLWHGDTLVDAAGPDRPQPELVATLLRTLLAAGDRVLVLGLGSGRLLPALDRAGVAAVDVVDPATAAAPLRARLQNDGPVPAGAPPVPGPACRVVPAGLTAALARLPDGARQAVVVAEPLHARADAQMAAEWQREVRRVAGDGLVVQPFALDRTPADLVAALLAAAAAAHPWNGVFAVGDCALLVSSGAEPKWPDAAAFAAWPPSARWQAHAAHIGSVADWHRAQLGTVAAALGQRAVDRESVPRGQGPADRAAVLAVLHECLVLPSAVPLRDAGSLFEWWRQLRGELRAAADALAALGGEPAAAARAQALAARFLPIGAPAAALHAALALPDADGLRLRAPEAASLCAQAIDPTFFLALPPVFAGLPAPRRDGSALEDFATLPPDARLAELCAGDLPLSVALRARFPSRCARALVAALAAGPLPPAAMQALREVADPFVLAEAGRVLQARAAVAELFALWRGDLPLPCALAALGDGPAAARADLAAALAGRRDGGSLAMLGRLLVDPERSLRAAARTALIATFGDRIDYDPDWPRSRLLAAAEQLRALHNRAP